MKRMKTLLLSLAIASTLAACGDDKVSFETLETNRAVANENSAYNAKKWRADNGMGELGILTRGDSTQQAKCPQGDGWASVDLTNPQTKQTVLALKCSTVSPNVGCIKASDFKDRAVLANQENTCNAEIPATLKKIEG
jgi:hypothetical protein